MQLTLQLLTLLGSVTLFLFGLSLLSGGLQKVAGDGLRAFLASMTSNPFKRILTGIGVTASIQSSTATTVMVVSFVNAGLLTLAQAIGVIMGANIGTTVTSWIMAVFGFSFDMATFAFPLVAVGYILSQNKRKAKIRDIGSIIIGFALFFIGFANLRSTAGTLLDGLDLSSLNSLTHLMVGPLNASVPLFVLIGTLLTICFQSSAATMAIVMLLVTTGIIPFEIAAAMILGENIGTTVAANIAASVGNTASRRAAMAHTVFNVFGVIWVVSIFRPFLRLVGRLVENVFGLPNPLIADLTDAAEPEQIRLSLLYSVTTMHTFFNLVNTCILVWFIPKIEALVSKIVPAKEDEDSINRLKYISLGPLSTAELSMDQAKHEIIHFSEISHKGFLYLREAINADGADLFAQKREKLDKYEAIADRMEFEIADYLGKVAREEVSEHTKVKIRETYKIIGELESLGDSGEAIGRMIQRLFNLKKTFSPELLTRLNTLWDLVETSYRVMMENLATPSSKLSQIDNAFDAETAINLYRDRLRTEHLSNVGDNPAYDYQTGVIYMDIASELEKMGDFIINISEAQIAKRKVGN